MDTLVITLHWAGGLILKLDIMVSFSHELDLLCGKIEQERRKLFQNNWDQSTSQYIL